MRPLKKTTSDMLLTSDDPVVRLQAIRNQLESDLGNLCSYCEMPLGGCEPEHQKPFKAWRDPAHSAQWDELLLICQDCRSHLRSEVLSPEAMDAMLWPDQDVTFSLTPQSPITYEPKEVRYVVVDEQGRVVLDQRRTLVFAVANPLAGGTLFAKARNTIDHFQLNMPLRYFPGGTDMMVVPLHEHEQVADHRTFQRTRVWNEAESAARSLATLQLQDTGNDGRLLDMLHDQISATAYFTGNWSIWMTVFDRMLPGNHALLHRLFLRDDRYFKGIDVPKLGLNL